MRIGTIDIGTNTVLLLVAEIDHAGNITPLAYEQRIPRLGKDVDARKIIGRAAFERVAAVLREYKALGERLGAQQIAAVGTSAVRDAANREEFLAYINDETGVDLQIVSGEDEARLTYIGAVSAITDVGAQLAVVDVGGGSTEITTGTRQDILNNVSLDIGSVRLTERYFLHDPPTSEELQKASMAANSALRALPEFNFSNAVVIGVAGTATTLAALDQNLRKFDRDKISNYRLTASAVANLFARLTTMKTDEVLALSEVTHGRADILTAGALILLTFMQKEDIEAIVVSERGVRYGLALTMWKKQSQTGS